MHRVIKSSSGFLDYGTEPVAIDNTVLLRTFSEETVPAAEEETETLAPPEEDLLRIEEERRLAEEEEKRLEEQRKQLDELAEKIRADAYAEAEGKVREIISAAQNEATVIRETAKREGFEEGKKNGLETAQKYIGAAAELISQVNAQKEAYFISHKDELLETSCYMAEKLIAAQLSVDKGVIMNIVAQAAKNFRNSGYLKISLAEGTISAELAADKDFIRSVAGNIPEVEIEFLPGADEGTVVLDNGSEIIDASVPTQLDFLKEIMENSKTKRTPEE